MTTQTQPTPVAAEVGIHRGRPAVFIDGRPTALPVYSPTSWAAGYLERNLPRFAAHGMGAYWLGIPQSAEGDVWGESPFYDAEGRPAAEPVCAFRVDLDVQARTILEHDPGALLLVRNLPTVTPSWRRANPGELFVTEDGERLEVPSLASERYWADWAETAGHAIRYCESRPWGARVIGYWNGLETEGTHEPLLGGHLFDHSVPMTAAWRDWLRQRYADETALREAHGDAGLTFDAVPVPRDRLRRALPEVSQQLYWQTGSDNAPLRDYLLLQQALFHRGVRRVLDAHRAATDRKRLFVVDGLKQTMAGWSNFSFFQPGFSQLLAYPEMLAGTGSFGVAGLLDHPGLDGLVTPVDYQVRGVGGVCEPEGCVDSAVLRGKLFFAEFDMRTYQDDREGGGYGTARNLREWEAINWRNAATALTRGFNGYWMDLCSDWYGADELHGCIGRTVEVMRESLDWEHGTMPGIAVVLDDAAVLETNGSGAFLSEAVMWEQKLGMSRCGVPYRIYLLEDLALESFPRHRLYYFPNLFRMTEAKRELLERRVLRDGNVVLWGPGSGISDGRTVAASHAEQATGFRMSMDAVNYGRRVHVQRFDHPITAGLPADTIYGAAVPYGPVLYPLDGEALGLCWTKRGENRVGLAAKALGSGTGAWTSVFTAAVPLPASIWRRLARFSRTHVYCESNDILLASREVVALHSIQSGEKTVLLPGEHAVTDLVSGEHLAERTDRIVFTLEAPETRVFRVEPLGRSRENEK